MKPTILNLFVYFPLIISTFFLAIRTISVYILPRYQKTNKLEKSNNMNKLSNLIKQSRGKFFSCSFLKKDGTIRHSNGKDFYLRLLASQDSPKAGFNSLQGKPITAFVDRNKDSWISASDERLLRFKCGDLEVNF